LKTEKIAYNSPEHVALLMIKSFSGFGTRTVRPDHLTDLNPKMFEPKKLKDTLKFLTSHKLIEEVEPGYFALAPMTNSILFKIAESIKPEAKPRPSRAKKGHDDDDEFC